MAKKLAAVFLAAVMMFAAAAPVFAEDEADLTALETAAAADDSLPARSADRKSTRLNSSHDN